MSSISASDGLATEFLLKLSGICNDVKIQMSLQEVK